MQQAAEKYASLLNDRLSVINSEYILWRQQWTATATEQRPDTATAELSSCSSVQCVIYISPLTAGINRKAYLLHASFALKDSRVMPVIVYWFCWDPSADV